MIFVDIKIKGEDMEEKKLSEFLKENGAYESFIENCLNSDETIELILNKSLNGLGIFLGFMWKDTPQGIRYWDILFNKSCELNIIYDMDEILYKEYEKRNMKESSEQNPISKDIVEENSTEDTKQEFQSITLNGVEYHLIPKEVSVGYLKGWYDKDIKVETTEESPLLTLNDLRDIGLSEKDLMENGFSEEDLRKDSREEYLKRKFEENKGKYEVLFKEKKSKEWSFCYRPCDLSWRKDWDYKLIKKEHKEIIEAYLKDTDLKVHYRWYDEDWMLLDDFIENYDEDMQLRIVKKEFEPFTLNIEVNTLDEAKSLWNRFNLNYNTLCRALCNLYNIEFENRISTHKYWTQIDDILKDFGEVPDVKP